MRETEKKIDWFLILLYLIFLTLGFLNLYSSDYNTFGENASFFSQTYGRQLVWIILSLAIAFFLMNVDSVAYSMFAYVITVSILVLLFLVFIFGAATHGAKSWIEFSHFKIQPSEFAKFATALALAKFISINGFDFSWRNRLNVAVTFAIIGLPMLLILMQPDVGSAMVYLAFVFVLYREGLPGIWLVLIFLSALIFVLAYLLAAQQIVLLLGMLIFATIIMFIVLHDKRMFVRIVLSFTVIFSTLFFFNVFFGNYLKILYVLLLSIVFWSIFLFIVSFKQKEKAIRIVTAIFLYLIAVQFSTHLAFTKVLKQHQRDRIEVLFDDSIDPQGIGYNLRQSKIAIGSGGLWGKGYLKGTQTKLNFVPEHNTDFIFCTIAEEWGFVGVLALFVLYAVFIIRIIIKAEQQLSDFSRIYGWSVAAIFFFHFMVNIGMTIGLLPVIGIPLPFFSYGGSAMLGFTVLLFIFIKLDSEKTLRI